MWSVPARHSDACITQTSKLVISHHTVPVKRHRGEPGHTYGTHTVQFSSVHTHGTRRRTKAHKRHTDHADDQPHNHPDSQTHITVHRQSFHFDTRGHRTGAHKGGTSTPLEGPWTVPGPIRIPGSFTGKVFISTPVHRQSFHFDTRGHRTGVHTDETSNRSRAPGPPYNSRSHNQHEFPHARATCCGLWVVGLVVAWRPFGG